MNVYISFCHKTYVTKVVFFFFISTSEPNQNETTENLLIDLPSNENYFKIKCLNIKSTKKIAENIQKV